MSYCHSRYSIFLIYCICYNFFINKHKYICTQYGVNLIKMIQLNLIQKNLLNLTQI